MGSYNNDNLYTQTFTPREYQVEILDAIQKQNTIVCSSTSGAKAFIAVKLVQELVWQMRHSLGKKCLLILEKQNVQVMESHLKLFTDLPVIIISKSLDKINWHDTISKYSVFLMTADVCIELLQSTDSDMSFLNLLIIDDCLYGEKQIYLRDLIQIYEKTQFKPRIVGLVSGLLAEDMKPRYLEAEMVRLEELLKSSVDTSSELATLIRLSCKPKEKILKCLRNVPQDLEMAITEEVLDFREFLVDHTYNPGELYKDFAEELRKVSDPKELPLKLIDEFLCIIKELGLIGAFHAAYHVIIQVEKMKVQVAFERHFLLLLSLNTLMVKVRAYCDDSFEALTANNKLQYFTPKLLRLVEVITKLGPSENDKKELVKTAIPDSAPRGGKRPYKGARKPYYVRNQPDDSICALIFVEKGLTARVLHGILTYLSKEIPEYRWIKVLYTVEKISNPISETRDFEREHRRQEDVLRQFRTHECNILVATSVLEQGYDLPKCNLVIRFDLPKTFHSYIQSKSRARMPNNSYYISLSLPDQLDEYVQKHAEFIEVEKTLLRRCGNNLEPTDQEIFESDVICELYAPYKTDKDETVSLSTAIQLVNRYCAKLPSDTFTKLVPNFSYIEQDNTIACVLCLPVNSPVKLNVQSPFVQNKLLARRFAAYYMCQLLHKSNELDDSLNPISKENFRASEEDWNDFGLEQEDEEMSIENPDQRPGTTKRRQYYFKKIAAALKDCQPEPDKPNYFYKIAMTLSCPIPEEQNTRGRRIYPPEESKQGFGILTSKEIPSICGFPIFTRSGEVNVDLQLCEANIVMSESRVYKIKEFLNYTFTSVLRLQKYQMLFNTLKSESSYFIVPTITNDDKTDIDWIFLDTIYKNRDVLPAIISESQRADYVFDPNQYADAVVMPWYRNQDQPQYFYVAEICSGLNPLSNFPGAEYADFEEYYLRKYNIAIQNKKQYLLDVDHTSARLNFLTPRYVNRKGVALPTSSEETKRAKRENLEQKQILVPELCSIHPFAASLWRKAVCLPCILYRLNALLLADQIRGTVANEIGLGKRDISKHFKWEPLNFGWSLSDVLKKSKEKDEKSAIESVVPVVEKLTIEEIVENDVEQVEGEDDENGYKIGTWTNDLVDNVNDKSSVRYGSPTSWVHKQYGYNEYEDFSDTESFYSSEAESNNSQCGGLHIQFTGDYTAEAIEDDKNLDENHDLHLNNAWDNDADIKAHFEERFNEFQVTFNAACNKHMAELSELMVLDVTQPFERVTPQAIVQKPSNINCADLIEAKYDYVRPISPENPKTVPFPNTLGLFSFDAQPDLNEHPGPSPAVILQAVTMSNANDGINLERLETIGDSFLKYAITDYLYSQYQRTHEGKLSHLRSKQVSNLNLYRLGKKKRLGEIMIATKFDPHDNWLPPCYCVSKELEEALMEARIPANYLTLADYVATRNMTLEEICVKFRDKGETFVDIVSGMIPYNLVTQHSIPDKSIADCVEALIGAYLIECGPRGALLFMAWLGIRVLPKLVDGTYGELPIPYSPLLRHVPEPEKQLDILLNGYEEFENIITYKFNDRSYLLQALTHASHYPNKLTDCYQRLEFLGDAVLDYLITRHLYEDKRMHSPGALTDLRSALVNNTIFASLAVRFNFHKYFKYLSPGLHIVIEKFIRMQEEGGYKVSDDLFLVDEFEDCEEFEDIEVPKVLGDVFESVAGAIFLDSGRSLDAVWTVYHRMMKNEIEQYSDKVPKSPIRELLELEPETAKFGTAEKLADGRRVRVTVEVFGKGEFKGIGRNYRIAKCTAAKCALKHLKKQPNTRYFKE